MPAHLNDNDNNPALGSLIHQKIAESFDCRITFAEFMDLALYHPQHGYYATKALAIGPKGDFFTSPHLGSDFGELLAEQFVQLWEILQRPNPFTLVEMGAGQGLLAFDVLRYLQRNHPELYSNLEYIIVERAATLIAAQQQQLKEIATGIKLHWCSLEEIPTNSITGCCFSNELVDALPVHQVVIESERLQEIYVTIDATSGEPDFSEVVGELSTPRLADYFNWVDIDLSSSCYPDRYRTEVNLNALDWSSSVANRLNSGYIVTIDYGYPSHRYYNPARSEGTLQCYYQHAHHSNPYIHIGQQDITAHVDFTALQRQGDRVGLQTVGFTQQGLFLMALGLGDRIAALSQSQTANPQAIQTTLRRREALHQLMNPMGLGNFGVLVQGKNLPKDAPLPKGLSTPPL